MLFETRAVLVVVGRAEFFEGQAGKCWFCQRFFEGPDPRTLKSCGPGCRSVLLMPIPDRKTKVFTKWVDQQGGSIYTYIYIHNTYIYIYIHIPRRSGGPHVLHQSIPDV